MLVRRETQRTAHSFGDGLRFLRALFAHPRQIGALAPSSNGLAHAVAGEIDPAQPGPVLELGPGTGALTRAILERGIAAERLTVIEYDPALAQLFAARFASVRVINADAFDLAKALHAHALEPFSAVVSGMPLLNYPEEKRLALLRSVFERMTPGAPFIQFSYGLRPPIAPPANVRLDRAAVIWLNLPPARVWVYRERKT